MTTIEVLFTPAEIERLESEDLSTTTCVVFDVLRATSAFVTALANGAKSILPVPGIPEALAARSADPGALLAGERNGLRLRAVDTGGADFDLGNSPREFIPGVVAGRRIISTTTNGTLALRACAGGREVFAAALLNLAAMAQRLSTRPPSRLLLVCAGTGPRMALEDVIAAGALCHELKNRGMRTELRDSAQVALELFTARGDQLAEALRDSENGRRLLAMPELKDDVEFCSRRSVMDVLAVMNGCGELIRG